MTDEEFSGLIMLGAEQRNVEYKSPGSIADKHIVNRVVRAILGMTNRQDGGYVVVGVEDDNGDPRPVGLDEHEIAGWTRDSLADKAAPLVDPGVDFDLEHRSYDSRRFVLITVREFDESPVFCRSTRNDAANKPVPREGALYVRGRRKPETVEIRTAQEMRDLLDLALEKRLRRFLRLTQQAGLSPLVVVAKTDSERFDEQIRDLVN